MTKKPTMEQTLAPDVDRRWVDEFIVALRMKGVAGTAIADALVEVNDHVRVSGEPAGEAFGPAMEYAGSLNLPVSFPMGARYLLPYVVPAAFGCLGATLVWSAVKPLRDRTLVSIQAGAVISTVLLLVTLICLGLTFTTTLTAVMTRSRLRSFVIGAIGGAWMAFLVILPPIFKPIIAYISPWLVIVVGAVALVVATFMYTRLRHQPEDPIDSPLGRTTPRRQTIETRAWLPLALMFPVGTIVMSAAIWFIF